MVKVWFLINSLFSHRTQLSSNVEA